MRLFVNIMKIFFHYGFTVIVGLFVGAGCQTASHSQAATSALPSGQASKATTSIPSIEATETMGVLDRSPEGPSSAFLSGHLLLLDQAVEQAIQKGKLPGGVIWFQHQGKRYHRAYGQRSVAPRDEVMTEDTIFDAASLTKVIATTPSIMKLVEKNQMDLDAPVAKYLPAFAAKQKENVTIRHLMTHTSGLRPGLSLREPWKGIPEAIRRACDESLISPPGTQFKYSDINFILLGEIVSRVSGKPLHQFASEEIFQPLKMGHTRFLPPDEWIEKIAPTTKLKDSYLRGVVHDPTSRRMGGVAGHAGLFTCAADLARFAQMMLGQGMLEGVRLFRPETISLMTRIQSPKGLSEKRGLGWDIDSPYSSPRGYHFPIGSYGHTGWTGTSIWIVPQTDTFLLFLSNRNHPTEDGSVVALRRTLATIAANSVSESFSDAGQLVLNGIDVLKEQGFRRLRGLKTGLITNHTGHDRFRTSTIDLLHTSKNVQLEKLFSPEHGIRGKLDGKIEDGVDTQTGLKILSLYGEHRQPQASDLDGLDALVFDIQDIGCRFYTYISTMGLAMEAASKAGLKFIVLDRANPINGIDVEGPVLQGETDFVGFHSIPVRHGMTVGELALMFMHEKGLDLDLEIIPVSGWKRQAYFDSTGQPWTSPSPNMRNLKEAILYPGIGILEFTPLSVGRGTDTPFEVVGAPFIRDLEFAEALNALGIEGVAFTPIQFTPSASVFKNEICQGVYISVRDRSLVHPVEIGVQIARTLHALYPESWDTKNLNRLLRDEPTQSHILSGSELDVIESGWNKNLNLFIERRSAFLLY